MPTYSIAQSRRVGEHTVEVGAHQLIVAEGIFALDLLPPARHFVAKRMMFGARAWP